MCEVKIRIDEAQVRKANPMLTDMESITRWAQHLMDTCIADLAEEEDYPLPENLKPYTIEELNARIDQAMRESAAGLGQDLDEFIDELEEEFAREDALEMAEAV